MTILKPNQNQSVFKCRFDAEDLLTVTLHVCILILDSRIILKPNHNCLMVETLTWCSKFSHCHALCFDAWCGQLHNLETKYNKSALKALIGSSWFSDCHAFCLDTSFRQPKNFEINSKLISFGNFNLTFKIFRLSRLMFGC